MRQWVRLRAPFDVDTVEPITDFIAAGDRVVVGIAWRATGQGPEMNMELTSVYTIRKDKIFMIENFWAHADALKAVGWPSKRGDAGVPPMTSPGRSSMVASPPA